MENALEFVMPQAEDSTVTTVSFDQSESQDGASNDGETSFASHETAHFAEHHGDHDEFDDLNAITEENEPLWTASTPDDPNQMMEVESTSPNSSKANFRMPLTNLKRRKSPGGAEAQEFHTRVNAKSKVMFSCDVCDLEFCDPKLAVKHISENHIPSMPNLGASSTMNQEPQLIISNPDGVKTQFLMDGQRLLDMDGEGVFIQMANSSIKEGNSCQIITSNAASSNSPVMQSQQLHGLSEFSTIKYETIPITSSVSTPLNYPKPTQKSKTVPIEAAPKALPWKYRQSEALRKIDHVEVASVPIRGAQPNFQQMRKHGSDEFLREDHLEDQNRNRQLMAPVGNPVVVDAYSSSHTSPLSFPEDVLEADLMGMSKSDKAVTIGEKRFTCEKCNKQFYRKNKLLQHMDGHAAEKMHQCQYCGKRFQFKTSLVHHLNCHSANPRFKCHFCGKILSAHKMLLKHLVKQHGQSVDDELVPVHKCEDCGYKTIYKSDLTKHRRKHTGEKPYRCPICFKEFSDSSILRRHEVVHTGAKPWKCSFCDKAYTLRSTLTNHIKKAHSAWANVNVCTYQNCNKAFATHDEYVKHSKECRGNYQPSPSTASPVSAKETEILIGNSSKQCKFLGTQVPNGDLHKINSGFQIVNVPQNDESKVQIIASLEHSHLEDGITLDDAGRVFTNQQLETIVFDRQLTQSDSNVLQVENGLSQEYRIVGILPENTSRKTMRVPTTSMVPISTYSSTMYDSDMKPVNQISTAYRQMVVQDARQNGHVLNEQIEFAQQNPIVYQNADESKSLIVSSASNGSIHLVHTVAMANTGSSTNSVPQPRTS